MAPLSFNPDVSASQLPHADPDPAPERDWSAVKAALDIEAEHVVPGMALDAVVAIKNPHLRAGAMLMTDLATPYRTGQSHDVIMLAYGVDVPEAGDLGRRAYAAYQQAKAANTLRKRETYAKSLKAYADSLSGFGRLAMVDEALKLHRTHADGASVRKAP